MQSGTTGINANRIYSPSKQALDHSGADYTFIRRWVPELQRVPNQYMANPESMPRDVQLNSGCILGNDYPPPIVDHVQAYRFALSELAKIKGQAETKEQASAVYEKHGSRKRPDSRGGGGGGGSGGGGGGGGGKRQAVAVLCGSGGGVAAEGSAGGQAPFAREVAASGRAKCRLCSEPIAKDSLKVCVSAWARGGRISANHHLACFLGSLRVEVIPANRGKCKHSGVAFSKGSVRVGYATTSVDEVNWLCLESAATLLPPMLPPLADEGVEASWAPTMLDGMAVLPGEQQVAVQAAFASG